MQNWRSMPLKCYNSQFNQPNAKFRKYHQYIQLKIINLNDKKETLGSLAQTNMKHTFSKFHEKLFRSFCHMVSILL